MRVTLTNKKPPLQRIPTKESLAPRKDRAESANRQKIKVNGELLQNNDQIQHRASISEKSDLKTKYDSRQVKKLSLN